jgi:hypothetical protein
MLDMRTRALVCGVLPVLALSACGSSSKTATSASHHHSSRPARTYRLKLTGAAEVPPGAPKGSGNAVIAIHGTSKVCFRFSHLHGFAGATVSHIHAGGPGKAGPVVVSLSTSSRLHHHGCVNASPTVSKAIEGHPASYYVNIHSKQYPGGAVRAQL